MRYDIGMNAALAALAAGTGAGLGADIIAPDVNVSRYPTGRNRSGRGFNPHVNRHTGQPHGHSRECARRLRQMARVSNHSTGDTDA